MNYPSIIGILISLLCIVVLFFIRNKVANPYGRSIWRSAFVFFALYILILGSVAIHNQYLEFQVDSFDLNNNGNIEMEEYTDEYRIASEKVTRDTARNFAFLTGAIFSLVISSLFLLIDLIRVYLNIKKSKNLTTQ